MTRDCDIGKAATIFSTMSFYDAAEALEEYGIKVRDADGNFRFLSETLDEVSKVCRQVTSLSVSNKLGEASQCLISSSKNALKGVIGIPYRSNMIFRNLEKMIAEISDLDTAINMASQTPVYAARGWKRTRMDIASSDNIYVNSMREWYQEILKRIDATIKDDELGSPEDSGDSEELDKFLNEFVLKEACDGKIY